MSVKHLAKNADLFLLLLSLFATIAVIIVVIGITITIVIIIDFGSSSHYDCYHITVITVAAIIAADINHDHGSVISITIVIHMY